MDAQDYKTFRNLFPLLFDNPFSSCWEHFHPCDCFYLAPSSCMKADTTNNIWGGWRTSDVKIVSVLILLSNYRHIFSWIQGQENTRWMVLMLLSFAAASAVHTWDCWEEASFTGILPTSHSTCCWYEIFQASVPVCLNASADSQFSLLGHKIHVDNISFVCHGPDEWSSLCILMWTRSKSTSAVCAASVSRCRDVTSPVQSGDQLENNRNGNLKPRGKFYFKHRT